MLYIKRGKQHLEQPEAMARTWCGLFQTQNLACKVEKIGRHRQGTWLRQEQEARAGKAMGCLLSKSENQ